jgi:hypothetical protein
MVITCCSFTMTTYGATGFAGLETGTALLAFVAAAGTAGTAGVAGIALVAAAGMVLVLFGKAFVAEPAPNTNSGRMLSKVFGPMPLTLVISSTLLNPPTCVR